MNKWMLRGLVFAAAMVVLRLFQGALINAWQTQSALISVVLLLLYTIGAIIWGVRDGRADAKANRDPDRRDDLAMVWLLGGLVAGLVSGLVAWIVALFYKGIYTGGILNELTTFAAFTALIVFVFAILGVAFGRWRVDRKAPPPEKQEGSHDKGRSGRGSERGEDTDVFSAVRDDDSPTGEIPTGRGGADQRRSSVATAGRESRTETIRHDDSEARTEVIRTGDRTAPAHAARDDDSDARTQVIRTGDHAAPTQSIRQDDSDARTEVIRTDSDHTKPINKDPKQ